MKHLWILDHYAQHPSDAGGLRHFSLARHLVKHSWRTTIIAASTKHPSGVQRLVAGERHRIDRVSEVDFLWLRAHRYSSNGVARIRNMFDYTRAALRSPAIAKLSPPDVIVAATVHPLAAWAGLRLARRYRVPFILEVRDLWPQTLVEMRCLGEGSPVSDLL